MAKPKFKIGDKVLFKEFSMISTVIDILYPRGSLHEYEYCVRDDDGFEDVIYAPYMEKDAVLLSYHMKMWSELNG
jgi:hypothetical protein